MHLNDIVSRFQNPKKNGNKSFMVRCPCHNDNQQSLSISEENGRILLNCFAGCRTEDILNSVGLEMKDLFADKPNHNTPKPPNVEYIYSDRLKKIRYYKWDNGQWKKSFYWQYKDENGNWQSGKGNYKVPLYKQNLLSDVPPEETVYIVEGEKDCDTMTDKLHFRAVSAPNGATATKGNTKSKWNSDYNSLFSNLNVAIIPDNDEVGRAYAETIANELLPVTKSVKIIDLCNEWVDLKDKGDITDVYETEQPIREMTVAESVAFRLSAWVGYTKPYERKPQATATTDEPTNEAEKKNKSRLPDFDYETVKHYKADDIGTAEFFSTLVKDFMCYVPEEKAFYIYNGVIWEKDVVKENLVAGKMLMEFVATVQKLIPPKPVGKPNEWTDEETEQENINGAFRSQYKSLGNANGRERVMKDIKKLLHKSRTAFDRQPELLNCKNCTYNLITGKKQPHNAADLLTKCVNADYDENAHNERFERFIDEICEGDEERKTALQTALGYSLIGATPEECFFIAYGKSTRNGKGTLFDLVLDTVGDYGLQMDFETIARTGTKDGSRATPDLARLIGVRYVLVNEPQKGTCFNEALVKQLTGSDDINARPLFGAIIQFKPLFTIFITTNNLPAIADDTLFSSDRIRILPFEKHFNKSERNTNLKSELREGNGREAVLKWLIDGYRLYKTNGLTDSKKGNEILRQYRKDNDHIQQFIDECLEVLDWNDRHVKKIPLTEIQQEYNDWCRIANVKPIKKMRLKEELINRGLVVDTYNNQLSTAARIKDNRTVDVC